MRQGLADEQLLHFRQRHAGADGKGRGGLVVFAEKIRQVFHLNGAVAAGEDQPLNDVAQLAHVARPGESLAKPHGFGGELLAPPFVFGGEMFQERGHEQGHVFGVLAQGRNRNGHDLQTIPKVFAELPRRDDLLKLLVCRRDDADVDADEFCAANHAEGAVFQHAQKVALSLGGEIADLVQEKRAAIGQLKAPRLVRDRAREGAFDVAEQFGFEQLLVKGGAIDGDEGLAGARALDVDGAGDNFLARAAFAFDQDGDIAAGQLVGELRDRAHRLAVADQQARLGACLHPQAQFTVFRDEGLEFQGLEHDGPQAAHVKRF